MLQAQGIMPLVGAQNSSKNSTRGKKRAADSVDEREDLNRKRPKLESHLPSPTEDVKRAFTADTSFKKRSPSIKRAKRERILSHMDVDPSSGIIDLTLED